MNPGLKDLQKYPFEKLALLKAGVEPNAAYKDSPINISIGEPKHEAPAFVLEKLSASLGGLSIYPLTAGSDDLRESIAAWLSMRFKLGESISPAKHILPVNGTREALFAAAQCFVQPGNESLVLMPNPFYQIYEGAAILAGSRPHYIPVKKETMLPDFDQVEEATWKAASFMYICTPGNPTGAVMKEEMLVALIEKALKYNFVLASDECYSELYFDENNPPCGILQAAKAMGNDAFKNCLAFHSLSKRSSLPGMRSGFVAGDSALIETFRLYRTYQGGAMPPPIQAASAAAWRDEVHVKENRDLYRLKFEQCTAILKQNKKIDATIPDGAFYLWLATSASKAENDEVFARELFREKNITVLPGSYLGRKQALESKQAMESKQAPKVESNPGANYVRIALVAKPDECAEAMKRIVDFY